MLQVLRTRMSPLRVPRSSLFNNGFAIIMRGPAFLKMEKTPLRPSNPSKINHHGQGSMIRFRSVKVLDHNIFEKIHEGIITKKAIKMLPLLSLSETVVTPSERGTLETHIRESRRPKSP